MRANLKRPSIPNRPGYTLLEMLLVLVVLVVAGSLVTPVVLGLYERHSIEQAAQQLGAQLTTTRLRAIDAGVAYRFRVEVGGRGYTAEPAELADPAANPQDTSNTFSGELPKEMRFGQLEDQPLMQVAAAGSQPASAADQGTWMLATLFLPDGSAIDAAFEIIDEQENRIRFGVRGVTGAVRVGTVEGKPRR